MRIVLGYALGRLASIQAQIWPKLDHVPFQKKKSKCEPPPTKLLGPPPGNPIIYGYQSQSTFHDQKSQKEERKKERMFLTILHSFYPNFNNGHYFYGPKKSNSFLQNLTKCISFKIFRFAPLAWLPALPWRGDQIWKGFVGGGKWEQNEDHHHQHRRRPVK